MNNANLGLKMKKPRSGEIMRNRRCRVAKPTDNSTSLGVASLTRPNTSRSA
jgi:hypothetical protein